MQKLLILPRKLILPRYNDLSGDNSTKPITDPNKEFKWEIDNKIDEKNFERLSEFEKDLWLGRLAFPQLTLSLCRSKLTTIIGFSAGSSKPIPFNCCQTLCQQVIKSLQKIKLSSPNVMNLGFLEPNETGFLKRDNSESTAGNVSTYDEAECKNSILQLTTKIIQNTCIRYKGDE